MSFAARSLPPADRDETPAAIETPKIDTDFFLGVSHDIFTIGSLHRTERDAFLHALKCSSERKPEQLRVALAATRASAARIASLAENLEQKLDEHMRGNR